jgi:hypothetical protein
MDYDAIADRVGAGFLQGIIVAFVGLAALLPASYVMNRYIYHNGSMRLFMGILAGLAGLGGLILMFLLRLYLGDSMAIHYFGMLPILTDAIEKASDEPTWFEWAGVAIKNLIKEPLTFFYKGDKADVDGYAATIDTLLTTFNTGKISEPLTGFEGAVRKNTVSERLFAAGRELGAQAAKGGKSLEDFVVGTFTPEGYTGPTIPDASAIGKAIFTND